MEVFKYCLEGGVIRTGKLKYCNFAFWLLHFEFTFAWVAQLVRARLW